MEKLLFYFQWWQEYPLPDLIEREIPKNLFELRLIPAFIGPRRSGKSTLFFQIIQELRKKIPAQNILYMNFEDDRLLPLDGSELSKLLDVYRQFYSIDSKHLTYLFLDEIQNVPGWENTLRRLYETEPTIKLFITGSNSRMLSSDLATALRGRTIAFKILPLNFQEFLMFKKYNLNEIDKLQYSPQINDLLFLFEEYLNFGGFPEVVLSENTNIKEMILKEYVHTIFFADIVQRYGIRHVKLLDTFIKILIRQMAALFSFGKMVLTLQSIGFKVSKNTLVEYLRYIEDAFMGKSVPIFSYSIKDQLQYPRKFYLLDNGLYRATSFLKDEDRGKLLENLVFIHLYRKHENIFYWKNKSGYEVDFVIPDLFASSSDCSLFQVCYNFSNETVRKREIRSLVQACKEFKKNKAMIITRNIWETIKMDSLIIEVKPFIQWVFES